MLLFPANPPLQGKVVRFGPNCVSFNSNTSLKEIYGFRSNVRKAEFYDAFVHPAANTHNTRDKEVHARKRRVLSHAFAEGAMKEMQRYILGNVRTFCEQLGAASSGAIATVCRAATRSFTSFLVQRLIASCT